GAMMGVVKWVERERRLHFSAIHLVAILCVASAIVSAFVSTRTQTSLLKAGSLCLLFVYGCCGIRVAVAGREKQFFRGLLLACEITSYLSGIFYLVLHFSVYGNPNSLGAIMGVVVVPFLTWGVLIAENTNLLYRRSFALSLAALLLLIATSRAGILA